MAVGWHSPRPVDGLLRSISPETNPPQWPSDGIRLGQWTGFSPAVAMEGSVGRFKLIPNTVRVFKG